MPSTAIASKPQQDPRVTARLIARIKRLIADGSVSPGSKFPPEREMAKEFGANRASVRQALKVLEMMGVLSQRVGDGTYLSESAETILNEPIDFLVLLDDLSHHQLFETRLIVEPEFSPGRGARHRRRYSTLRNAVLALERSKVTRDRLEADMAFHNAIFRASGNRICQLLFKGIHRTVLTSMNQLSERVPVEQPLKFHRKSTPPSAPATRKLPGPRCATIFSTRAPCSPKDPELTGCEKSLASLSSRSRQAEEPA